MDARRADLLAALLTGRLTPTTAAAPSGRRCAAAGVPGQTAGAGGHAVHDPARGGPAAVRTGRARPDHRRARPRDRHRRHPRPPGLRPASGTLLDHGRSTYRPPAGLADHVRARDSTAASPSAAAAPPTANSTTSSRSRGPTSEATWPPVQPRPPPQAQPRRQATPADGPRATASDARQDERAAARPCRCAAADRCNLGAARFAARRCEYPFSCAGCGRSLRCWSGSSRRPLAPRARRSASRPARPVHCAAPAVSTSVSASSALRPPRASMTSS